MNQQKQLGQLDMCMAMCLPLLPLLMRVMLMHYLELERLKLPIPLMPRMVDLLHLVPPPLPMPMGKLQWILMLRDRNLNLDSELPIDLDVTYLKTHVFVSFAVVATQSTPGFPSVLAPASVREVNWATFARLCLCCFLCNYNNYNNYNRAPESVSATSASGGSTTYYRDWNNRF